jgi:hypothetical protein
MKKTLKFFRILPALMVIGASLLLSGCYTLGQFSAMEEDLEWLDSNQFQFTVKPTYSFDDVMARAMTGATAKDCEYFVLSGPVEQTYPLVESRFPFSQTGVIRQKSRKVYVVTCYPDAASAPPEAQSVKTHLDRYVRLRPKSPIFKEISTQRKARGMRPANEPGYIQL